MSAIPAYHLPAGEGRGVRAVPLGEEPALLVPELDAAAAGRILTELEEAGEGLRARENAELLGVLGTAGARFLDPEDPLHREAVDGVTREGGYSAEMSRLLVGRMAADWTGGALGRLLVGEFPDPRVLEGFRPGPGGDRVRALGDPLAFHVGAGNVAGVGAASLLRSLLVRTPLLLKPGRGDVVLPVLLARAIAEEDSDVGAAVAVVYWAGGSEPPLERAALERARRVVVYGGTGTVARIRERLPVTTPLVAYPHRISVGALARERLDAGEAERLAGAAAEAVSAYDQRGCVSPHTLWVEEGGDVSPARWANLLAAAMARVAERFPPGRIEPEVAAAIHQLRGAVTIRTAAGKADRVLAPPEGLDWTVLFESSAAMEAGCGGRLVRVRPIAGLEGLPGILADRRDVLQSVALEAEPGRRERLAAALAGVGVSRITELSGLPWPGPWWVHDGAGPLRVLVRWASLESP